MTPLGRDTQTILVESARALAVQHNLVCTDGSIICWACRKRAALMPSLHCPACLAEAWHRLGIIEPQCPNYEQEKTK
jgi:hypothetical protein